MQNSNDIFTSSQLQIDLENGEKIESTNFQCDNEEQPMTIDKTAMGEVLEANRTFNFEGFQVVRREFFAHTFEPSITFNNYKLNLNTACLNKFPYADFAQVLVNREQQILAVRPCSEKERDAFEWCTCSKGKRRPKQITCKLFFAMIFEMMNWNPDYRYKLLGKVIHANGEYLIAFDMTATEIYQRTTKDGKKLKSSRIPVFPNGWKDQFGLPYYEHQKSLQINIFDGYAVYGVKDNAADAVNNLSVGDTVCVSQSSVGAV